jgi:hypothetical protein
VLESVGLRRRNNNTRFEVSMALKRQIKVFTRDTDVLGY